MNLTTLTHRDALCLNARFTSREEAIHVLTQRLAALGKISSTEQFLEEVYRRESLGPTALGEGLAVPHGKTAAVKEAAFAVATLSEPLQWEGVDGPEAVDLVVLLAIPPNEAGTTHMQLLTALTTFCLFFQRANYRLRNGLSGGYCSHLYGCGISGKSRTQTRRKCLR